MDLGKRVLMIDDLRTFSVEEETEHEITTYVRSLSAAMSFDEEQISQYTDIYLDHDLGNNEDIRPFVRFLEEEADTIRKLTYPKITIHIITSNPVGREYIRAALSPHFKVLES